ncbi:prephenate dehydrogenase [Aerococcus sanguinicola]|uniref:Prephenate dehydrogenase/arogenate dehydrogenase family protein n=1 Tax=Aerococcus sanguinicola TaxID=119206 RepID=A0A2I1MT64_9LACT|nr:MULTISPECIES: prephenate dehydrogenase [Aerococcus]MDK7049536.1 prephenate dehydrogenase [Aerococcus sanguinicola]OFT96312.1 prephenate dehydrogenase [Aerococcus sp. HMSC23C02]PKZ23232.1 prephenate dehydrogenase/arogenate dehydrogenase family protein [Aerococcus sanguinicola]
MKIVIVGLGAIGSSFAQALTQAGYQEIRGIDQNPETCLKAEELGIVKTAQTEDDQALSQADLIFITLHPQAVAPYVESKQDLFKSTCLLTDVTGIKRDVMDQVEAILRPDLDFIYAHPMRGSEKAGIAGLNSAQFRGANALLVVSQRNQESHLELIEALYRAMGFQEVSRVDAESHDRAIAYVSQLMHVLAVAAVNSAPNCEDTMQFAGNSFQELTRIADVNAPLWTDLFLHNQDYLLESIEAFEKELVRVKTALKNKDSDQLQDAFQASTQQRREWYVD